MLHKVQLLIGAGCPEILSVVDEILFFLLAFFVSEGQRGFFAKRRIRQNIVHSDT